MILFYLFGLAWLVPLVLCGTKNHTRIRPSSPQPFLETPDNKVLTEELNFANRSWNQYTSNPVVFSACGRFEGTSVGDGKYIKYDQFLGIRYAEPPLGKLRFKNPVPWTSGKPDTTYLTTEFCPPCMQPKERALEDSGMLPSEDCLCLNIYRPADCNEGSKKPVLVYIHGSYYLEGSAARSQIRGGFLATYGDMIVVTMNYRLGAFGFLYSGDDQLTGSNMGFMDTVLATQWVQKYIGAFGGDPDSITVAGHGAGGALSTFFLYEPSIPDNLFRAIMALSPDYNQAEYADPPWIALRKSKDFAELVGCGEKSSGNHKQLSKETVECLKNVDARLLAERSFAIPPDDGNGICAWNQLLPHWSYELKSIEHRTKNGQVKKGKRVYIGGVPVESTRSFQGSVAECREDGEEIIEDEITPIIRDKSWQNMEEIFDWYFGGIEPSDSFKFGEQTTLALTDVCYVCPTINLIANLKKYEEVYFYYYLYIASCDRDSKKRKYSPFHADDTPFNFGIPLRDRQKYNDQDRAVSLEMMTIFSDFVHGRKMKWPPRSPKSDPLAYLIGDRKKNYYAHDEWAEFCPSMDA